MGVRSWVVIVLGLGTPATLAAQWVVGAEVMAERVSGVLQATDAPERSFTPYRPFWIGLRVELGGRQRLRPALALFHARPDLALEGEELVLVPQVDLIKVYAVQPMVVVNLAQLRDGVNLRGEVGPVAELWKLRDEDDRFRLGGQVGLSLEVALGGRFSGVVAGHIGVLPRSPLDGVELGDLDGSYEPTGALRRSMRGGVRVRL